MIGLSSIHGYHALQNLQRPLPTVQFTPTPKLYGILQGVSGYKTISEGRDHCLHVMHTFEVEKYVGLVVFKHLSDELDVHVLYIDFLHGLDEHTSFDFRVAYL